jgi:cysteine desulfurase
MTVYLDHASTTPLRREVLDAMTPVLEHGWGNPGSPHAAGRQARELLDDARERLARRLGAEPREIVFTSGGSESDNLAIKGAAWAGKAHGHRIVTTAIEHHAVGHTVRYLEKFGFEIVEVPVDRYGRVDPDQLEAEITDRTTVVSVMYANNEVGTIQPIADIAQRVHTHRGVVLHVDAVQAAAWLPLDLGTLGADLVSLGAHKFEGPKGVGALYVRHGTHLLAQQHGGSQERYRRAGTEDVAGAVGIARAYELTRDELPETVKRVRRLRERLQKAVLAVDGTELTGHPNERLPGLLSLVARETDGHSVVLALDLAGIAAAVGSACTSGSTDTSHVLAAMGYPEEEARGALRLSLGRTTTDADIDAAVELIPAIIARQRGAVGASSGATSTEPATAGTRADDATTDAIGALIP